MEPERFVSRRDFMRSALTIGGVSALSACQGREERTYPTGSAERPLRQFAWNEHMVTDPHGNTVLPHYQLLLFLDYRGDGVPTEADREAATETLETLEKAYQWGTGGDLNALSTNGLFFMLGYSPAYFERFTASLPEAVDLPTPRAVLDELDEQTVTADSYDSFLLLTSDHVPLLLAAEQALFGDGEQLNGVEITGGFDDVFAKRERRTGFKGKGVVHENLEEDRVPEQSPSAMGYKSGFSDNQATEDQVAIDAGPFTGGTTAHVSKLTFDLSSWYGDDEATRVKRMFSPHHDINDVGEVGDSLASDSEVTKDDAARTGRDAEERGRVGHTQKVARARNEDFEPRILRRSEAITSDSGQPGMNFISLQRGIEDFVETRTEMYGTDVVDDVAKEDNGILDFITMTNRANFLVPPRTKRALPSPRA